LLRKLSEYAILTGEKVSLVTELNRDTLVTLGMQNYNEMVASEASNLYNSVTEYDANDIVSEIKKKKLSKKRRARKNKKHSD